MNYSDRLVGCPAGRKLRIAHVIGYFQPKLGYQEYYLALKQQELGHEVFVVTSDRNYPYPGFKETYGSLLGKRFIGAGTFTEEQIKVVRLPCAIEIKDQIFVRGLTKTLMKIKPDVVHIHDEVSQLEIVSFLARELYRKRLKYKLFVDCHADYLNHSKSLPRRFLFNLVANPMHKWLYRRADGYIGINEGSCRWLSNELGIELDDIDCIPLGVDTNIFKRSDVDRVEIRTVLGIEETDIVMIYAGKIIPIKDLDTLLYASAPLLRANRGLKLLLVGSGPSYYMKTIQKIIDELSLDDKVIMHTFVRKEELPKFYSAADFGIWPGGISITIQEAMSTQLPIIIIQSDSAAHLIEYENGLSFPRGNIEALRKCISLLTENETLRVDMGRQSQRLAKEKLSWANIARQVIDVYSRT